MRENCPHLSKMEHLQVRMTDNWQCVSDLLLFNYLHSAAMVQMLRHQDAISSNILLSVLDMCTDKSMENFTGQFSILHFMHVCMCSCGSICGV